MRGYLKKNQLLILLTGLAVLWSFFSFISYSQAATSTLRGYAWWGSYDKLFFSCQDDETGDALDVPGNLYSLPEPRGFHFYSIPCVGFYHQVAMNTTGIFSGSAWNRMKGFVTFDATTTPPDNYSFASNCQSTCNLANNCWACYNENDQKVYGWARVIADGTWLKLNSATTSPVQIKSWNANSSTLPFISSAELSPGDFLGYATSTDQDLSFNCLTENLPGGGIGNCTVGNGNYKVRIGNLQVGRLSAPNWSYQNACDNATARKVSLSWSIKSGEQSAYRIIINDANTTSSPRFDSGKISSLTASQMVCPGATCAWTPEYNTNYYWWIQLWDESDQPTEYYQYGLVDGHNGLLDEQTSGNPDSNVLTFTTYKHEFPSPYFTWFPFTNYIVAGTTTLLTSQSQYYTGGPGTMMSCAGAQCRYNWTSSDPKAKFSNATNSTSTVAFPKIVNATVSLKVTDIDNYFCSTSTPVLVINYQLPIWREVKAE